MLRDYHLKSNMRNLTRLSGETPKMTLTIAALMRWRDELSYGTVISEMQLYSGYSQRYDKL